MNYEALEEAIRPPREARPPRRRRAEYNRLSRRAKQMKPAWVRVCDAFIAGKLQVGTVYSMTRLHKICKVSAGLGTAYLQFDLAIHRAPLVLVSEGHGSYRIANRFAEN